MSERGDVTVLSFHFVDIDMESLPTGIDIPNCGQRSSPTACTAANRLLSSSSSPLAAIQLADNLMLLIFPIFAATILVIASATAMRADFLALDIANGALSPMAKASPVISSNEHFVTATFDTGVCHGPTI